MRSMYSAILSHMTAAVPAHWTITRLFAATLYNRTQLLMGPGNNRD